MLDESIIGDGMEDYKLYFLVSLSEYDTIIHRKCQEEKMKLRVPDYYEKFNCIGSACRDSCCVGWEIGVDEEAYEKYSRLKGEFGDRLMNCISSKRPYHFIMEEDRCPFLNEQNLCDIFIHMGKEFLCQICADHPRFYEFYGNCREAGLGLVCEEAARLILTNKQKVQFLDRVLDENEEEENPWLQPLFSARDCVIRILQDRNRSLGSRLKQVLSVSPVLQEDYIRRDRKAMYLHIHKRETKDKIREQPADLREWYTECSGFLLELEILTPEWKQQLTKTAAKVQKGTSCFLGCDEIFYEQLMIYFVYRYFMKSLYDFQLLDKIKFAVFGCLCVRGIEAAGADEGELSSAEIARLYSKEIEYSEENMEMVSEELLFSELFDTQRLSDIASAVFESSSPSAVTGVIYE